MHRSGGVRKDHRNRIACQEQDCVPGVGAHDRSRTDMTAGIEMSVRNRTTIRLLGTRRLLQVRLLRVGQPPVSERTMIPAIGIEFERPKQHVNVLGPVYSTVCHAYSTLTVSCDKPHAIVERCLRQFACPSTSILYLDGEPAQEKEATHQA